MAEETTIQLQKISEFVTELDRLVNVAGAVVYGVDANGHSVKIELSQISDTSVLEGRVTAVESKAETNRQNVLTLQTSLNGKSNTGHTHAISDVTDLQTSLSGKSNTGHTHAISDVTDLQTALNGKSNTGHSHAIGDVAGLRGELDNKAPLNHTHTIPQIEQLQSQINTITGNVTDIQAEVDSIGVAFGLPLVDDLTTYDAEVGKIVKYVGTTTSSYTHGYDYEKTSDGWVLSNSQPDNTSELSDRITTNANNITTINNKIGAASGIAELDTNGKVPQSQLPSFVDDVEEYSTLSNFPATGESGKIYIATDTNITYRWGGSTYVPIGSDLALGETASTAYRGDRGKTAYDHSQTQGNPHGTTLSDLPTVQTALNNKQNLIGRNEYLKQVANFDNYQGENGEIVEYVGQTSSNYVNGYTYKSVVRQVSEHSYVVDENNYGIAAGVYVLDTNATPIYALKETYHRYVDSTETEETFYGGMYWRLVEVGDFIWNDNNDVYTIASITAEQGSYFPIITLNNGYIIKRTQGVQKTANVFKNGNLVIYSDQGINYDSNSLLGNETRYDSNYNQTIVLLLPVGHQFGNAEYYSDRTSVRKWEQTDVQPRFSESYNDLTDKPLSVESGKVKYTLSDGTTKLTLAQEDDLKAVAFSGSYNDLTDKLQNATTTTAGVMSAEDKVKLNGIATGAQVNPTVSTTTTSGINCAKYGRLCFISGYISDGASVTLSAAYKPAQLVYFTAVGGTGSTSIVICRGYIDINGVVVFAQPILAVDNSTISFNPSSFPVTFSVAYLAAS